MQEMVLGAMWSKGFWCQGLCSHLTITTHINYMIITIVLASSKWQCLHWKIVDIPNSFAWSIENISLMGGLCTILASTWFCKLEYINFVSTSLVASISGDFGTHFPFCSLFKMFFDWVGVGNIFSFTSTLASTFDFAYLTLHYMVWFF